MRCPNCRQIFQTKVFSNSIVCPCCHSELSKQYPLNNQTKRKIKNICDCTVSAVWIGLAIIYLVLSEPELELINKAETVFGKYTHFVLIVLIIVFGMHIPSRLITKAAMCFFQAREIKKHEAAGRTSAIEETERGGTNDI